MKAYEIIKEKMEDKTNSEKEKMRRGEIYYAALDGIGNEQKGVRPVLIIQNDVGNTYSNTVVVAILTSKLKSDSIVMAEQIRTIDKSRIKDKISCLKKEETDRVNKALQISLAM